MSDRLLIKRNAIDLKEGLNSSDPYATVPGLDLLRAPSYTHQFNSIGAGRRNLVINGDFRIAQRGTSFPGNTGGAYTLDRWTSYIGEGTWDITRETDAPPGHAYSFRWENTSAFNAGSALHISHRIEASDCEQLAFGTDSPQPLTISFWVKTSKIGRYNLEIDVYAVDGTPWSRIPSFYVNNADVWEHKEITVLGASNFVNRTTEGTAGIGLNWWISAAGQFITGDDVSMERWDESGFANSQRGYGVGNMGETANNFFMLAGVQCEVGPRATPFERRTITEELILCQRYYERIDGTQAWDQAVGFGDKIYIPIKFHTQKRDGSDVSVEYSTTSPSTWGLFYGTATTSAAIANLITGWGTATSDAHHSVQIVNLSADTYTPRGTAALYGIKAGQWIAFESEI